MTYRQLSKEEINQLEKQSCVCKNWSEIEVTENFNPGRITHVKFSGKCRIGSMDGKFNNPAGISRHAGIHNSCIHHTEVMDNVYISNVGLISNYIISADVVIENVDYLTVTGKTSFGNGTEIEVLNEGGGRELIIYDQLTAQIAWLMVILRHDPKLVSKLEILIKNYCDNKTRETGEVGSGASIINCNTIENIYVGERVMIRGATHLENGTVSGDEADPTTIGHGVIARNFIALSGSVIDQGALIDSCFIGQGVHIGKQFSAENSVFFANCEGFHGEAVSLFAGPYTVTHHKSTLLIAGMYSFYNAGSGTNQSNHMYKLGPVHQGIVERGSKTGSFSYLLWPSRVGAFSVVMGKHGSNFDASDLPFSYITVDDDQSMLTPAMNLLTVGTKRDSEKWPKRDRRKSAEKYDLIHFDLFNPYVVSKVVRGIDVLNDLYEKTPKEQDAVNYKGLRIKRLMLKSCRKYYEMAMYIFLGDQVLNQLEKTKNLNSRSDLVRLFKKGVSDNITGWTDLSGMIISDGKLDSIIEMVKKSELDSIGDLRNILQRYFNDYENETWSWSVKLMEERTEVDTGNPGTDDLTRILEFWKENSTRLNNMILSDAKKEFNQTSRIGYGLCGDPEIDFENVRGKYEENSFVESLLEENKKIEATAEKWISKLKQLK